MTGKGFGAWADTAGPDEAAHAATDIGASPAPRIPRSRHALPEGFVIALLFVLVVVLVVVLVGLPLAWAMWGGRT